MQGVNASSLNCRRRASRFETPDGVWACWRSQGSDDVSQVRDLSAGGLFLATEKRTKEGTRLRMEFLVREGQIKVEGEVRHSEAPHGLGLQFTAIREQDRQRLSALLTRLRGDSGGMQKKTPTVTTRI
jgi:hypothetical protein